MKESKFDVIVIGAGIVGVSTAIHLQQNGLTVALFDKNAPGSETSFGNSGIIENSFVLPFTAPKLMNIPRILMNKFPAAHMSYPSAIKFLPWIFEFYQNSKNDIRKKNGALMRPLLENAILEHKHIMKDTEGINSITRNGRVALYRSKSSFDNADFEREMAKEYGVPYQVTDANEFHEIEAAVIPNFYKAVSWLNSARYLNLKSALHSVVEKFTTSGGVFLQEEITDLEKGNNENWAVRTQNSRYFSHQVVVCAGPWSNSILHNLGHKLPIAYKRGYHKHVQSEGKLKHALVDVDVGYLIVPLENKVRLTTGVEFADLSARYSHKQIEQILPRAAELFNFQEEPADCPWIGSRPSTTDSLPIIGQSEKHKGLWFNTGHGHSGVTIGPSTARLVSEMMLNKKTFCDPDPYSLNRFY